MQVREELIASAFALAKEYLAEVRRQTEYPRLLRRLTDEAVVELGESSLVILRVDPCDTMLVEPILAELGVSATVEPVLDCIGGLEACTADGRIVVSNTFETRLGQARLRLRREVADLVTGGFEVEQWQASTTTATPA
jgi:vacuolar-type H+-ATPase subunit E/Vma4